MKSFFNISYSTFALAAIFFVGLSLELSYGFGGSYDGAATSTKASGDQTLPDALVDVGIEEHLGAQIPLDATFKDEQGKEIQLSSYFKNNRPVLLNFAYYKCPMLCNMVLNGMLNGMKKMSWAPGKEFEVVTISMDSKETFDLAQSKKETHINALGIAGAENGWHFLTGEESQIRKVSDAVGFKFKYMPLSQEFAHSAAVYTISPKGKISRYLYGVEYRSKDLKLALLDASEGKAISLGDRIVMFCYRYDATAKGYVLFARNFMKGGGIVVILGLGLLLGALWRREFNRKNPVESLAVNTTV